jgi:hypothetical protein
VGSGVRGVERYVGFGGRIGLDLGYKFFKFCMFLFYYVVRFLFLFLFNLVIFWLCFYYYIYIF